MRTDNITILQETLRILDRGSYEVNGKTVKLQLSRDRMESAKVLLPNEVREICSQDPKDPSGIGWCIVSCVKMDSFEAAISLSRRNLRRDGTKPVLVLNFANPVNIGGGVYKGARAQEEDLCRKSSLLWSLESDAAFQYYQYNRGLHTYMGSDAMIFSPEVEIIRDENGRLLEETSIVAVLTCAAPLITRGMEGLTEDEYRSMVYNRIVGILKCAAHLGYENLVLGAWGCGAFGNDAAIVSDLFYKALLEIPTNTFREIVFAVRSSHGESYNYREFFRNFSSKIICNMVNSEETRDIAPMLAFCERNIPVLQKIENDDDLKIACRDHSAYERSEEHESLIKYLYESFVEEAYSVGMVIAGYGGLIHGCGMNNCIACPTEDRLKQLDLVDLLACISWHFRSDHFSEGSLISKSIAEGHMLRMLKVFAEKAKEYVR